MGSSYITGFMRNMRTLVAILTNLFLKSINKPVDNVVIRNLGAAFISALSEDFKSMIF